MDHPNFVYMLLKKIMEISKTNYTELNIHVIACNILKALEVLLTEQKEGDEIKKSLKKKDEINAFLYEFGFECIEDLIIYMNTNLQDFQAEYERNQKPTVPKPARHPCFSKPWCPSSSTIGVTKVPGGASQAQNKNN